MLFVDAGWLRVRGDDVGMGRNIYTAVGSDGSQNERRGEGYPCLLTQI